MMNPNNDVSGIMAMMGRHDEPTRSLMGSDDDDDDDEDDDDGSGDDDGDDDESSRCIVMNLHDGAS